MWLCQRECSPTLTTHESFCSPRPSASAGLHTVYSEHRVVPSRPALSRRSCLEPFIGHPGRYAPSQADPQISSIARPPRWAAIGGCVELEVHRPDDVGTDRRHRANGDTDAGQPFLL